MRTSADLNQALQSLQLQTKKNAEEMHQKEDLKKHAETENFGLANEIKNHEEEIRIEEQKVFKLKQEILLKKRRIEDNTKIVNKSIQEITHLRMESMRSQSELANIEREYKAAVNANSNNSKMTLR